MPDAVGHGQHGHQQRLVVGGDARVRQRGHVDRPQPAAGDVARSPSGPSVTSHPHSPSLRMSMSMWSGRAVVDGDLAAGHADGGEVGGRLDPVGDHGVLRRVQLLDALDLDA